MTLMLHHIAINALDPVQMASFYQDSAGFKIVGRAGSAIWLTINNFHLAIYPAISNDPALNKRKANDIGIAHFCLQNSLDGDLWARMDGRGMTFNDKPAALGTGATYAYGRDPEGNLVEIEGVPNPERVDQWCGHVALVAEDIDALAEYYSRLLGRSPHREGRFQHPLFTNITGLDDVDNSAAWIATASVHLELWQYHNPPPRQRSKWRRGMAGYRHIAFACENLDETAAGLSKAGIVMQPGDDIAGEPALWARDPDGNLIGVFEMSASPVLDRGELADPHIVARRTQHS